MDFTQCLVLESDLKIDFFTLGHSMSGLSREQVESFLVTEDKDITFYTVLEQ